MDKERVVSNKSNRRVSSALKKSLKTTKHVSKKAHHHLAKRPHNYLSNKFPKYAKWHQHKHHRKVHFSILAAYAIAVGLFVFYSINTAFALSTWSQSDWSGGAATGAVTGTVNTYESASNIKTDSGALSLDGSADYAVIKGSTLSTGSTNLNVTTPTALKFNTSQSYNTSDFSYSSGSPTKLTVQKSGNYFLSYTLAAASDGVDDSGNRSGVASYVYVNGSKADVGGGRSGYIRNYTGHFESSNHLGIMLNNLSAGDEIEVKVSNITSDTSHTITGDATLYAEYLPSGDTIFSANGTQTTSGTNLNSTEANMDWDHTTADTGFTHTNSDPSVTLDQAGSYLVSVNIPVSATVQRASIEGRVLLDGSEVHSGEFQQGYIRDTNGHTDSSIHWFGVVQSSSPNQVLTISAQQKAASGTVTVGGEKATLFIKKLSTSDLYVGEATQAGGASNWNPNTKSTVDWATDNAIDTNTFSHSTSSNNQNITVQKSGDYLLSFDAGFSSTGQRVSPKVTVQVNGVNVTGAEATTGYIRAASGHNESSDNVLVPLTGLSAGDVITVSVEQGSDLTTSTSLTGSAAQLMIQRVGYPSSGTLTSNVFNATYPSNWSTITYNKGGSGTVTVKVRSDSNSDMSGAPSWSSCDPISSGTILANNNCVSDEDQYLQYQVTLQPSGVSTPTLSSISFSYTASDYTPPDTNASNLEMYKSSGGDSVASNGWTNASQPYFSWDAGSDASTNSSGVKGYCLYLGQDDTADPVTTKGLLGTSPVNTDGACQFAVSNDHIDLSTSGYIGTALTSLDSPYYLNVKIIDNANNVYTGSPAQFHFRFDNTEPTNPAFITAPSQFVSSKDVTLSWETSGGSAASDANSGLAGLQYRIDNSGTWYGDSHSGSEDATDLLANDGSYTMADPPDFDNLQEGNNIIYFRTWDNAGNVSTANVTTAVKLNTSSPSSPQNISATPSTNTTNSFAFSWLKPASYTGSASNLTYCYTFNSVPTANNCTYTDAGVTSLPAGAYATQPGENTIYVVAKDEAGNVNYATASSETFTANTSAPGIPLNMEIADVSTKSTKSWKLALSWNAPNDVGAGVSTYRVYRSTDNSSYSQVASSSGSSIVDTNLSQTTYYYKVRACDSANNCGAYSSVVSKLPTGRFTSPASLVVQPSVSNISTRKTTITWATDRDSDSKIAFGTQSGVYNNEEVSNSTQTTNHTVNLTNLSPGTTYYYKAKWTDGDGNTGTSSEHTFTTLPPPTVKDVSVNGISLTSANIRFTSKDAVQVKIYYGKSEGFGGLKTINTSSSESAYTKELQGLDDGAKYFFKVDPIDSDGNEYDGTVLNFETPPRPRVSNLRFQPVKDQPTSTQKITWTTNVPSDSLIRYGVQGRASDEIVSSKVTTDHAITISGLQDDSEYVLVAESRDTGGNLAVSDQQVFHTDLDTRPPKISDVVTETNIRGSGAEARGQIVVSWKTDEPATSQVAFGEGSSGNTYNSKTSEDNKLTKEHLVIVSDLSTSQVYHLKPISKDKAGNEGSGKDRSAIIGRASDGVLDIIINTIRNMFGV